MALLARISLVLVTATAVTPLAVVFLASLLAPGQYSLPPIPPSFTGYWTVAELGITQALLNSALVAVMTAAISLAVAFPTAYAITRLGFGLRFLIAVLALVAFTRSIPPSSLLVAVYQTLWSVGMLDSHVGLALAYQIYTLPMALWILLVFIYELNPEIEAAAKVDGASPAKRMIYIALPLARNGMIAAAVLSAIEVWGEYLYASVLLSSQENLTASVLIGHLVSSEYGFEWNILAAASTLASIPPLLMVGIAARTMTRISLGGK